MAKSKTDQRIEEATASLRRDLGAYQEAFWCLRAGKVPLKLSSGDGEREVSVELLGAERASGGVIIQGPSVWYATDWCAMARETADAYVRDLAHKVERAQKAAIVGKWAAK